VEYLQDLAATMGLIAKVSKFAAKRLTSSSLAVRTPQAIASLNAVNSFG